MGKVNQASAAFCLALGLAVSYASYRLGYGTLNHPGPGFLPFWCGIFLAGLSLLVFAQGRLAQRRGDAGSLRQLWSGLNWHKSAYVVLALFIYTLALPFLGFSLCTLLLLVFLFKVVEPQDWAVALGAALVASLLSYLIFARWLDVQLPRGILEKLVF